MSADKCPRVDIKIDCCAYSYRKHLTSGAITMEDFIDQAAEAYQGMNEHPERGIKLGIDHTLEA